jgi:hypothetical protein
MARTPGIPATHLADFDLIRFADGEMPAVKATAAETHLRACAKCRERLEQLRRGSEAYEQYHSQVLKPALPVPGEWPKLGIEFEPPRHSFFARRLAAAVLACCVLAGAWLVYRGRPEHRMQQVLAQAERAHTPAHGRLRISVNGHSWYRTASLHHTGGAGYDETRALFVNAHYSWDDPLSARSFAAWRKQLPEKRDQVFSIENAEGRRRFYRLQTETSAGVLRSAALTLRADDFEAVRGTFHFEHQSEVDIEDASDAPQALREKAPIARPAVARHVTAAEELRVFAALNAIGADVGEPVSVDTDSLKQEIVITGVGLTSARQRQIRAALGSLPHTELRFDSSQLALDKEPQALETKSQPTDGAPLRAMFEAEAGGATQFQELSEKALDASSAILAQANALQVLAEKFPPDVESTLGSSDRETLGLLRRKHAEAIYQEASTLKDVLAPLLPQGNAAHEIGAAQLLEQARLLDGGLARVLAGSYSKDAGLEILSRVPDEIQTIEVLAKTQEGAR